MNDAARAIRRVVIGELDLDGMLRAFAEYRDWSVIAVRRDDKLVVSLGLDDADRLWLTMYTGSSDSPTGEILQMDGPTIATLIDDGVHGLQIDPGDDSTLITRPSLDHFVSFARAVVIERVLAGAEQPADVPRRLLEHPDWHVWRHDDGSIARVIDHRHHVPAIAAAVDTARRMVSDVDAALARLQRIDGSTLFALLAKCAPDGIAVYVHPKTRLEMPATFAEDVIVGRDPWRARRL